MDEFGVQLVSAFGSFGEMAVGAQGSRIRARYLLTKMRPGLDGDWDNELASQMVPWREVFKVEDLSFEELLQRDLDDSRVAHDLIPYLLGQTGARAPFFPPILAVIVPKKDGISGIEPLYPPRTETTAGGISEKYGELFKFEQVLCGQIDKSGNVKEVPSPLGRLLYNRQRSAFVIVDGQHRAMAVLALHRQLMQGWKGSAYAAYYDHIRVTPEQVRNIALPVCIVYFPDVVEGGGWNGPTLTAICRELFVTVNRSAKPVSASRELLLDDADLAARMMRQTLSKLKNRGEHNSGLARIYSFAFGDSDGDLGKQVVAGQLEYSSAVALYKLHSAASFGRPDAFRLMPNTFVDVSSMVNARNPVRPITLLAGTEVVAHHATISKNAGRSLSPNHVEFIVEQLGGLTDRALLALFDEFQPFVVHNSAMRRISIGLTSAQAQADMVTKKVYALMFEGSGVRNVFFSHYERLLEQVELAKERGEQPGDHIKAQLAYCESVNKALEAAELELRRRRACSLFSIDFDSIYSGTGADQVTRQFIEGRAKDIFVGVGTQAFQLGYLMAIEMVAEELLQANDSLEVRRKAVDTVVGAFMVGLNRYFSPKETVLHTKAVGYIKESRTEVFSPRGQGLRGLLGMSVSEINEKRWDFFAYAILEIIHGSGVWPEVAVVIRDGALNSEYENILEKVVALIREQRARYIQAAIDFESRSESYQLMRMQVEAGLRAQGQPDEVISKELVKFDEAEGQKVRAVAQARIVASIGKLESPEDMKARLVAGLAVS